MGILEVLIPLTASNSVEVQGNAAAAIGNLSAKADDYTKFNDVWLQPEGGLHSYLTRFLQSPDRTFQHIAVWTIVQFLDSGDVKLANSVRQSQEIKPFAETLVANFAEESLAREQQREARKSGEVSIADANEVRPSDSISQNGSVGSDEDYGDSGEAEIPQLAKRILDML